MFMRLRSDQTVENISDWLGKTLSAATRQYPTLTLPGDRKPSLAGSGINNSSTKFSAKSSDEQFKYSAQPPNGPCGSESGENDPPHLFTHSQTGSIETSSRSDTMDQKSDIGRPPQLQPSALVESKNLYDPGTDESVWFQVQEQEQVPQMHELEMKIPSSTWTRLTSDGKLVQHLLTLYFCWEYPTFVSFSKEHFLRDFQEGRQRYCSPILVNAVLALGCRFSSRPMTRANPNDPYTSGDHFFKESQRLLNLETGQHKLTTIQALGIMSVREASCGRDSESRYYAGQAMRLVVEMELHRDHFESDEDELAVQSATFWGAFALDQ